ncbi:MAG: hypothetical protein IT441_08070 [Phycisphaeraceae bacterium]|nr:hypothetical protein [Phycisphaeraceae bacterium]
MTIPDRPHPDATSSSPAKPGIFQRLDLCEKAPYTLGEYAKRFCWELTQATLVNWAPRRANAWRRFWICLFGAKIPPTSKLGKPVRLLHPWKLTMGQHSSVAGSVKLWNAGTIDIGDHTTISQDAELCAGSHDYTQPHLPMLRTPVKIGSGVWVCARAFIGPTVTVGDNCIVGACAVVMRDVPPGMIVAGNPAVVVKPRPMGDPA